MMGEGSVLDNREAHGNAVTLGGGKGKPQTCPGGIREGSSEKAMRPIAKLKCLYTNARSMGNKWEELETVAQFGKYDLIAITETWWDESHDWNTLIEDYRFFRRDRQARRGGGVALCVRKWINCEELCLRKSHDQVESLWVKIKDRSSKGHLVAGVCCRPPDQEEAVDEAALLHLQEVSRSRALVLMGGISSTRISAGIVAWWVAGNPGDSWNLSRTTSWSR